LIKPLPAGQAVIPARLLPESPLDQNLDATLVCLDGRLIAQSLRTAEEMLTVQIGRQVVDATFERGRGEKQLPHLAVGGVVRLTGVYVAGMNQNRNIQSFRLLLRSPADVVLLSRPSWWTAQRTVGV